MQNLILQWVNDGNQQEWKPTTLDQIGQDESFLETVIAGHPELLHLETKRTGILKPFSVLRQRTLTTPQGRAITPDLLIFASSGDVILVEVKLFSNPELRDRRVIAQTVDYVASISALREKELVKFINRNDDTNLTWSSLVEHLFPEEEYVEELAKVIYENIKMGNINIIIACDRAPVGLYEIIRSVSNQSVLGFTMDVVEIVPFVRNIAHNTELLFVPHRKLSTEIVSRTAITVTYLAGTPEPSVDVSTTSIEEVEKNIISIGQGNKTTGFGRAGRSWSEEEIEETFMASDDPVFRELFIFAKQHSFNGRVASPGSKVSAAFGFYILGTRREGKQSPFQVYNCVQGSGRVKIYLNSVRTFTEAKLFEEFSGKLKDLLKNQIDTNTPEPSIDTQTLSEHLDDFKDLTSWLQASIEKTSERQD